MRRVAGAVVGLVAALAAAPAHAGDGSFSAAPGSPLAASNFPVGVVVGDFNNDGDQDLAVAGLAQQVLIFVGGPGASFTPAAPLAVDGFPFGAIAIGDFNEDRDSDLAVPTTGGSPSKLNIFTGGANATFTRTTVNTTDSTAIAVADLTATNDVDDDLVVGEFPLGGSDIRTLKGAAGSGFTDVGTSAVSGVGFTGEIVTGDFNGNGREDVAVAAPDADAVDIFSGNGVGTLFDEGSASTGDKPLGLALGDFDTDGDDDLAATNQGSANVSVLAGRSSHSFSPVSLLATGTNPRDVVVGDFNSDGDEDLAIASNRVDLLIGGSALGFSAATPIALATAPSGLAVGDFDGDLNQDLAVASAPGASVHVLLGGGQTWNSGNLLQFGGIEGPVGDLTTPAPVPAPWSGTTMTFLRYGTVGPPFVRAQNWEGGSNFFSGGVTFGGPPPNTSLTQTVNVSANAADIDAGVATARLSALLGGLSDEQDHMSVTATFRDAAGAQLGRIVLGPVTRADRNNRTVLLRRFQEMAAPASTRSIEVRLDATQPVPDFRNTAMADNVKLSLTVPPPPAPPTPPADDPPGGPGADTTDPETTIDKGPKAKTEKEKAKFAYSANEPATFECKLKGASRKLRKFAPCDAAKMKYKNLDSGKKKFQVRAVDAAGNVDPTPAKLKWKVL